MLMKILTVLFGLSAGFTCYYLLFSFFPQLHLLDRFGLCFSGFGGRLLW